MKNKILKWLFRNYAKEIEDQSSLRFEAYKQTLDIKDLIRERLRGIRPNRGDNTILQSHIIKLDDPERLVFLSKADEILKNETFRIVADSLVVESEHKSMLESGDMNHVNFNRATINGIELIEEELTALTTMFNEEQTKQIKMTEGEKHEIL